MRFLIFLLLVLPVCLAGQADSRYFQQRTDYVLDARLDTLNHQIHGHLRLVYQNNSTETLNYIWFHLWPKAYSTRRSEFARRKAESGDTDFHFSGKKEWGDMDSLNFTAGGKTLQVVLHPDWVDVVQVMLDNPLPPGGSLTLETPFRTTIPTNFSRLGREGKAYQISQWYPKPAVFDRKGWHPMPYLDQGEFYSEFGAFTVTLTVPANHIVAATGNCQTVAEQQLLQALAGGEKMMAPTGSRTFTYTQDSIHDFAWFADPDFKVATREFSLPSGKRVTAQAFYKPKNEQNWKYGAEYLERSVRWYSTRVGEYPYSVVRAVDGALLAGGGMEYPTITVIGAVGDTTSLEQVILHEVGHNWFYGILASNERRFPWMDEGINSFYEHAYTRYKREMAQRDSGNVQAGIGFDGMKLQLGISGLDQLTEMGWMHTCRSGNALSPGSASDHFSQIGYGVVVYGYAARLMDYLEAWLGKETFDQAMQTYYRQWAFRHPYPEDMQAVLESVTGKKLDWFFEGLIQKGATPDFSIRKWKPETHSLVLRNQSGMMAPVQIAFMDEGKVVSTQWTEPFSGKLELTGLFSGAFNQIHLNQDRSIPEINTKNNVLYNRKFISHARQLKIGVLPVGDRAGKFPVYVFPVIGGNTTDGFLAGLWLSNQVLPSPKFRFTFMPAYGFGSQQLLGTVWLRNDFLLRSGFLSKIQASFTQDAWSGMQRTRPQVTFYGRRKDHNRSLSTELTLGWNAVWADLNELSYLPQRYDIGEMRAEIGGGNKIRNWKMESGLRWQPDHFLLWENTLKGKWAYRKQDALHVRMYAGYFLDRQNIQPAFRLNLSGSTDYLMNQVFLDRAMQSDAYRGIVNQTDGLQGGFASWYPISSDQWLHAVNFRADVPFVPFQLFADVANFQYAGFVPWDAGFTLKVIPEIWEIYFPVLGSQYNGKVVSWDTYGTQIRFLLKLNLITPDKLAARIK